VIDSDKHSSLLRYIINYDRKNKVHYKTLQIHNMRKMDRLCSKLVNLSKPVEVADDYKDASLLGNSFIFRTLRIRDAF